MKKRYTFAIIFSLIGVVVGYLIGWLLFLGIVYLGKVINIGSFEWIGATAWISFILGLLPLAIFYASPIIGFIRGWKHGYKIGVKKEENANKI